MPTDISEDERAALLAKARAPVYESMKKDRIQSKNIAGRIARMSDLFTHGCDHQVAVRAFQLASAMAEFCDVQDGENERSFVNNVVPPEHLSIVSAETMAVMLAVMSFDTREDLRVRVYYEDIVDLLELICGQELFIGELESLNGRFNFGTIVQVALARLQEAAVLDVSDAPEWIDRDVRYSDQSLARWAR